MTTSLPGVTEPSDDAAVAAFYLEVGRRFRSARGDMTQGHLAKGLNLTRSSVANLEAGRQRIPVHTLVLAAQILRVDVASLVPVLSQAQEPFTFDLPGDLPESSRAFILGCLEQIGVRAS